LTAAYTVFPNNGVRRQSYIIERIDDASGETIYRASHLQSKALDPGVSWMISTTLGKVMERGTAAAAKSLGFAKPAAGKTGTTNDFKDAWFVGYTTSLTCGVWVGLDKPETIIQKGYGSALALPIWVDVMKAASPQRYPAENFRSPGPLRRVTVCSVTNELATNGCDRAGTAYSIDLPETRIPRDGCGVHHGTILAQDSVPSSESPKAPAPVQGILRSFRKFFGGQ
jgi:penicillin-binding protein 1A